MNIVKYNDKSMFLFLKDIMKETNINLKEIANLLDVSKGTVERWNIKKSIPSIYFNSLNRITPKDYSISISDDAFYKLNDMFFTPTNEAIRLVSKTIKFIENNWKINLKNYNFIDPSVGKGAFFNAIEFQNKIGIDLNNNSKKFLKMDYFDYFPINKNNIVIGNPPFGLRGNLALKFINHSANFSDFICMILPPLFNSNGKGSPMLRIDNNFYLAKEFKLKTSSFYYPNGKPIVVNSIFQIWTKLDSPKIKPIFPPNKKSEWVKVYSLSNGNNSSSKRNVNKINICDLYLPSTTFGKIKFENNFKSLPNKRGYGLIFLKNQKQLINLCKKIDWQKASFKSTNGANNLRTQLIIDAINKKINNCNYIKN